MNDLEYLYAKRRHIEEKIKFFNVQLARMKKKIKQLEKEKKNETKT